MLETSPVGLWTDASGNPISSVGKWGPGPSEVLPYSLVCRPSVRVTSPEPQPPASDPTHSGRPLRPRARRRVRGPFPSATPGPRHRRRLGRASPTRPVGEPVKAGRGGHRYGACAAGKGLEENPGSEVGVPDARPGAWNFRGRRSSGRPGTGPRGTGRGVASGRWRVPSVPLRSRDSRVTGPRARGGRSPSRPVLVSSLLQSLCPSRPARRRLASGAQGRALRRGAGDGGPRPRPGSPRPRRRSGLGVPAGASRRRAGGARRRPGPLRLCFPCAQ